MSNGVRLDCCSVSPSLAIWHPHRIQNEAKEAVEASAGIITKLYIVLRYVYT